MKHLIPIRLLQKDKIVHWKFSRYYESKQEERVCQGLSGALLEEGASFPSRWASPLAGDGAVADAEEVDPESEFPAGTGCEDFWLQSVTCANCSTPSLAMVSNAASGIWMVLISRSLKDSSSGGALLATLL